MKQGVVLMTPIVRLNVYVSITLALVRDLAIEISHKTMICDFKILCQPAIPITFYIHFWDICKKILRIRCLTAF